MRRARARLWTVGFLLPKKARYDAGGYQAESARQSAYAGEENPYGQYTWTYYGPFGASGNWDLMDDIAALKSDRQHRSKRRSSCFRSRVAPSAAWACGF